MSTYLFGDFDLKVWFHDSDCANVCNFMVIRRTFLELLQKTVFKKISSLLALEKGTCIHQSTCTRCTCAIICLHLCFFKKPFQKLSPLRNYSYRKKAISNTSHLEAQAGFIRLLSKGIFDHYLL